MVPSNEYPTPEATGLPRSDMRKLGGYVAEKLSLSQGFDIDEAVRRLGGRVHRVGIDRLVAHGAETATIQVHGPGDFDVFIAGPGQLGPVAERFAIAHELGHYFAHFPLSETGTLSAPLDGLELADYESDRFAEGFLIPSHHMKDAKEEGLSPSQVAERFKVSRHTISERADELGIELNGAK